MNTNLNYSKFKRCELREELKLLNKAMNQCRTNLNILEEIFKIKAQAFQQLDREIANVEKITKIEAKEENKKKGGSRTKHIDPVAAAIKELPKGKLLELIASVRASQS